MAKEEKDMKAEVKVEPPELGLGYWGLIPQKLFETKKGTVKDGAGKESDGEGKGGAVRANEGELAAPKTGGSEEPRFSIDALAKLREVFRSSDPAPRKRRSTASAAGKASDAGDGGGDGDGEADEG